MARHKKMAGRKASGTRAARFFRPAPHSRVELIVRRKEYGKAPVEKHFVLHDGRRIESLYQLVDELEMMTEETFRRYANEFKNDFATWVREVFNAPALANRIQRARDRAGAQKEILLHLVRDLAHVLCEEHRDALAHHAHDHKTHKPVRCIIKNP